MIQTTIVHLKDLETLDATQPLLDDQFDKDAFLQTTAAVIHSLALSMIEAKIMQQVRWKA